MSTGPLASAIRAVLARRRRELPTPPSPDELIAYHEGRLSAAERERLERALGAFPESASALRDMAAFPAVEPVDPRERLSPAELTARWESFRGGLAGSDTAPRSLDRPRSSPTPVRWILGLAAAAAIILALIGLWRLPRGPEPAMNVTVLTLEPKAPVGERGAGRGEATVTESEVEGGLLVRLLAGRVERFPSYRVTVSTAAGKVWRGENLRRRQDDTLTVYLPPGFLAAGRYELELEGIGGAGPEPLESYGFMVHQ